jgi:hypothetical protein
MNQPALASPPLRGPASRTELSLDRLKSAVYYCPESGWFIWMTSDDGQEFGARADMAAGGGYRTVTIGDETWRAHRLAVFYMSGVMPSMDIDHIDGNPGNNAYANLREVTRAENMRNRKLHKNNISGVHGVYPKKHRWLAAIGRNGKKVELGSFADVDDAIAARREAEKGAGFHPNHGRSGPAPKKIFSLDVTLLQFATAENQVLSVVTPPLDFGGAQSWYEIAVWPTRCYASVFGTPLNLPRVEFRILELLVSAQGLTVSREAIWAHLYGSPFNAESRTIDMHVTRLRRRLDFSNTRIHSERDSGYRLESKSPLLASIIAGNRFKQIEPRSTLLDSGVSP